MRKIVWIAGICCQVAVCLFGCGARIEVAKDKALAKIDSLLGSMDVKRKEIEHSVAGLNEGLARLRKAKITAQVKQEQIERRAAPVEQEMTKIDASLKKLKDHLTTQTSLQIAGKVYQPEDVKAMANRLLARRKDCSEELNGLRAAQGRLQKVVATLERKQVEYERRLAGVEAQLAVIDSNRIALAAMKDAACSMEAGDKSLSESVARLEEKVTSLFAEVEVELRAEDAQWDAGRPKREIDSVNGILEATRSPGDTIREIDAILGNSKVVSKPE